MTNRGHIACMLVALLILPVAVHAETQDGVTLEILVDWDYGWWSSEIENNYVLQFADDRNMIFQPSLLLIEAEHRAFQKSWFHKHRSTLVLTR